MYLVFFFFFWSYLSILHKRESLYMLPKGKFIFMLKRKFCFARFWFLTIVIVFVFLFFLLYTSIESIWISKIFHFSPLKSVKSSFPPILFLELSVCLYYINNKIIVIIPDLQWLELSFLNWVIFSWQGVCTHPVS
jgi:hypothetical protein